MDSAMLRKEFQAQKKKIQLTKKQLYLLQNKMKETEERAAWAERADKMNFINPPLHHLQAFRN